MPRSLLALCLAACVAVSLQAAEAGKTSFLPATHKDPDGSMAKYVVFVPDSYKGEKEYPLILFLHGSGETGDDGTLQLKHFGDEVKKRAKDFPFIVVFPQSQKRTWKADSSDGQRAIAILDEVCKKYKVDSKRVYLTGLSMGGSGTWSFAAAHPQRWAAIVPICGSADLKDVEKIKHLPCWCFVGDKDRASLVENLREMMAALKKAGAAPRYTEYPGVGHNSWVQAYGTDELYSWLLKHNRK